MPLSTGTTGDSVTVSVVFDKPAYGPTEPIGFRVVVDGDTSRTVTVTGDVTLTDRTVVPVSGATNVGVVYGQFGADGYDVVQDQDDPSRYVATPTGGAT